MAKKYVRFNYYQVFAKIDIEVVKGSDEYKNNQDSVDEFIESIGPESHFDINSIVNFLSQGKKKYPEKNPVYEIKGKDLELDLNSLENSDEFSFFQIAYYRKNLLPSKKTVGEERQDVDLSLEEYITEFSSVLYHYQTKVLMFHTNAHAINKSQLEGYLLKLLLDLNNLVDSNLPGVSVQLVPVIDQEKVSNQFGENTIIDSFNLKGSSNYIKGIAKNEDAYAEIIKGVEAMQGIEFEVIVKATYTKKDKRQLAKTPIQNLYNAIKKMPIKDSNLQVKTRYRENENSPAEEIDWLIPIMHCFASFETNERVGMEWFRDTMKSKFSADENRLIQLLVIQLLVIQ